MTKALLLAAAIAALPALAQAQAVPPSRFVGPPVALAGPDPAVPASRPFVGPPAPQQTKADTHDVASSIGTGAAVTGGVVEGAGMAVDLNTKMLKTAKQYSDGAGLVTPYAETGVDYAKAIKANKEAAGKVKVVGNVVAGVELAADVTAAGISCSNGDVGNCVMDSLDVGADLAAQGGPMLKAGSIAYTAGKLTGKAITWGYEKAAGQSLGADWYDWVFHEGETAKILSDATTPAAFEAARQKRKAAYSQAQGALMSKQADYDAQQARIEAERQAAAQQAAQQAASAYQAQNFLNNVNSALQPLAQGSGPAPAAKCGYPYVCFNPAEFAANRAAATQPAAREIPAPRPPTSTGGCHPTEGHVCTVR